MKRFLLILFAVVFAVSCFGFSVEAEVSPKKILAGEMASYSIIYDAAEDIDFKLPEVKNIRWFRNRISTSRSFSSMNGKVTRRVTRSITFTVDEPGEYEIPPVEISCGKASGVTGAVKFSVLKPGSAPGKSGNTPATAKVVWPHTGRFYTGQWIPLEISLVIPDGMRVSRYSFPRLTGVENLIFHNFSANGNKRDFGEVKQQRTVINNVNSTELIFPAVVRAISAKTPDVGGSITVGVVRNNGNSGRINDDFFDSFFDRMSESVVPVNIKITPAEKTPQILPLPDAEKGVFYFGTFGKLVLKSRLSQTECAAGEAADLILELDLKNTYMLKAPDIKVDGFRIYPPDLKYNAGGVEIRYCLIPLSPGEKRIAINFASFDPENGKYLIYPVTEKLSVTPSKNAVTLPSNDGDAQKDVEKKELANNEKKAPARSIPLYIKSGKRTRVHVELWKNSLWFYLAGLLFMPLGAGIIFVIKKRSAARAANPDISRAESCARYAIDILKDKNKTGLSDGEMQSLIAASAYALRLDRGAGAGDVSRAVDDENLKEWFNSIDEFSFSASGSPPVKVTPAVRAKLLKIIKRTLILVCTLSFMLNARNADSLFDAGQYAEAAAAYRKQIDKKAPSPELLYNAGTSYLNAGVLSRARACLVAAHKLAPRDEEITENLNFVNRKLLQEEVNRTDTPLALFKYCRDRLRPDEHAAMASLIFGIAMLLLAFNASRWKMITGIAGAFIALFILLMTSQLYDSYRSGQAVTLPDFVELKQLPSDGRNETVATIPGGSDARVLQIRGDWVEIECNGRTGWVRSDAIAFVFSR